MSKELIKDVADQVGISQKDTKEVVDTLLDGIKESLSEGEDVNFFGFGKFTTSVRAARKGRNPATGKAIDIPEKTVVQFKPAKGFKDYVNQ